MKTFVINSEYAWESWRAKWNSLTQSNPMSSLEWLQAWWQHYGTGHQLHIIAVSNGDRLVGAVPCYKHQSGLGEQLRFLGSGAVCSDYLTAIVEPNCTREVYEALGKHMLQSVQSGEFRGLHSILFEGMSQGDEWFPHLSSFAEEAGFSLRSQEMLSAWALPLPSTWAEFLKSVQGRSVYRKAKKCISRLDSRELVIQSLSEPASLDKGMLHLIRLHKARRNSLGDDGCFSDPRFEKFLRQALTGMMANGKAVLNLCESEGVVIGIHLQLYGADTVFVYQSGLDPDYMALEAGHAAVASGIRDAISKGYKRFDLLRGDEAYKAYWGAQPTPLQRLILAPPTLKAQAIEAVSRNWSWLRSCYKELSAPSAAS